MLLLVVVVVVVVVVFGGVVTVSRRPDFHGIIDRADLEVAKDLAVY